MCESSSLSVHGVALNVSRWRDPSVEEVAAMLLEAAPHLVPSHADAISGEAPSREASRGSSAPHTPPQSLAGSFASRTRGSADASSRGARLKSRLDACVAADVTQPLDWSELSSVVRSEDLAPCAEDDASTDCIDGATRAVDVNSGGAVFFCVFGADSKRDGSNARGDENAETASRSVAVVKFCADRLACVSEHFAGALAGALGVATPACRLARRDDPPRDARGSTTNEWFAALDAARRLCSSFETDDDVKDGKDVTKDVTKDANANACSVSAFAACLEKHECALAQRFVIGAPFFASPPRRSPPLPRRARGDLAEALGRVFVLDCLLGNADRLPCAEMGWRGNAGNLLLASENETETETENDENDGSAFFLCAIDQSVARRVPRRRALEDAAAVPRVLELVRNRPSVARRVFAELCGGLDGLERAGFVERMSNQSSERDEGDVSRETASPSRATESPKTGATDGDLKKKRVDPDDDALWPADVRLATRRFVCGTVAAVDACGSLASVFATTTEALRATLAALFDDLDARGNPEPPASREASPEKNPPPSLVFARARVPQKAFFAAFPGDAAKDDSRDESTDALSSKRTRSRSPSAENAAGFSVSDPCVSPPTLPIAERGTMRLRSVQRDARASSEVDEWLRSWSTLARREKAKLRSMLADWSARRLRARRGSEAPAEETPDATGSATSNARTRTDFEYTNFECAFLDVTEHQRTSGRDVVDLYELWARVSRLSERALRVFETASTRRPSKIAPGIFLGGALEANAKHTLLSLGITHVLNCAKDEIPHDAHEGTFVYEGVRGIRDVSSRGNADAFRKTFAKISAFLDSATKTKSETSRDSDDVSDDDVAESGGVLVHCFEGKSRSATAAAQHLIRTSRFRSTAAQVMKAIAAKRADARPNAWFAKALEAFANEGARRVDDASPEPPSRDDADDVAFAARREKPRARRCPKCGAPCGVSALSVQAHVRREHRDMYA